MVSMSENNYQPGTYRKGESVRVADTASDAVDLVWNGYKLDEQTDGDAEGAPHQTPSEVPNTGPDQVSTTSLSTFDF